MLLSFLIMLGTIQLGVLRRYADAVDADVHDVLVPRASVLQSVDSGGRRRRHVLRLRSHRPRKPPILFGSIRVNVQSELTSQSGEGELRLVINPDDPKQKHPPAARGCSTPPHRKNDLLGSLLSGDGQPRPRPLWHRYSHCVVRRRSCFSCGEVQGGSGAFCIACGKPLEAPDLEFLSVDSTATTGNDVVLATGGGKGRSALAIVAVLAALGGVAAFSGKSTTTTARSTTTAKSAKSTTTAVAKATGTTISTLRATTTVPPDVVRTTVTDAEDALAREIVLTQPRTLATPILPEKTGAKLLLSGLTMLATGQRGNAIVDLDSGLVTPYPADGVVGQPVIQTYGSGLLLTDTSYGGLRFDTWQPTGPTRSVGSPVVNSDGPNYANALTGDVFWSIGRSPLVSQNNTVRLMGFDVRDGHTVTDVAMPESTQLIGSDAANHPVVVDYGSGTYSFDSATQQFTRITTNMALAVRGDWRVERACTEQLVCGFVLQNSADPPRPVPDLNFFGGPLSLSPNGQTLVQVSYPDGGAPTLEAVDLIAGTRQKLQMDADTFPMPLSWSADGMWLFGRTNGVLATWKVGTTETRQLAFDGDPVRVEAFGVFPS